MKLYIIRHAQSTNNALANPRDRVEDPLLTELGLRQAEVLAEHLAAGVDPEPVVGVSEEDTAADSRQGYNFTHLYCSAMHRSLLTARPVAKALGLTPEVWVDIHEHGGIFLDHGGQRGIVGYPGRTRAQILEEFPDYVLSDDITDAGWWNCDLGMEDWPGCMARAIKVANTLREWSASRQKVAIITHGGFMNVLLKALTNQLPASQVYYHHFNTAITRVDFRPDGAVSLRYINRFDHLPPDLIS